MNIKDKDGNTTNIDKPIIFFDGVCGLCNKFVNYLIDADKNKLFHFSPLQGETAKSFIEDMSSNDLEWTMFYADEAGIHDKSTAALKILKKLGGFWSVSGLLIYIPKFLRDSVYEFIAANRYKWFGKNDSCRIPTQEERDRFLK